MGIDDILRHKRKEILRIAEQHGAHDVRVFGSVASGKATENSDVDFLVRVGPSTSPWFPAGLILGLEDLLRRKVDVVTENALHWYIRDKVLKEAVPL